MFHCPGGPAAQEDQDTRSTDPEKGSIWENCENTIGEQAGHIIALQGPNEYPFIVINTFFMNNCCF